MLQERQEREEKFARAQRRIAKSLGLVSEAAGGGGGSGGGGGGGGAGSGEDLRGRRARRAVNYAFDDYDYNMKVRRGGKGCVGYVSVCMRWVWCSGVWEV